jgi:tryptophanyl-tRNA synthetase
LSDIYAALAYYYDHREEIRNQIEDDEIFALEMKKTTVSLVQQKLKNHYERQN